MLQPVDEVMLNNNLLARSEIREFQNVLTSGAEFGVGDDEMLDPPELECFGMSEIDESELCRWAMLDGGNISASDDE